MMNLPVGKKPIEEEMNMFGYMNGAQDVYVTIDSFAPFYGRRIRPGDEMAESNEKREVEDEEGLLVRFSLMNEIMLQTNQEALESLKRSDIDFSYRPYYYVFETFVSRADRALVQWCDSVLRAYDLSCEELIRNDQEASIDPESWCKNGVLVSRPLSNSAFNENEGYLSLIGLLGYSGEGGYDYAQIKIDVRKQQAEAAVNVYSLARNALDGILSDSRIKVACESDVASYFYSLNKQDLIARIYYVGQANATCVGAAIPHKDGQSVGNPGIYFDLGEPTPYVKSMMKENDRKEVKESIDKIGGRGLDAIAISHWHWDHYAGATWLLSSSMSRFDPLLWILPNADFPNGALSLIIYLLVNKRTVMCAGRSALPGNGAVSFHKGTGSLPNDSGIMFKVKDTVFSGDCNYTYWPDALLAVCDNLRNLVVPHHGSGEFNISKLGSALGGTSSKKDAYISVGKKLSMGQKPYKTEHNSGHPSDAHIDALRDLGFDVKCTKDLSNAGWYYYKISNL